MQVASFTGERQAVEKYEKSLQTAYKAGVQEGLAAGLGAGVSMLVLFCSYALAVWYGSKLIIEKGYTGGEVLNIIMAVLLGSLLVTSYTCTISHVRRYSCVQSSHLNYMPLFLSVL